MGLWLASLIPLITMNPFDGESRVADVVAEWTYMRRFSLISVMLVLVLLATRGRSQSPAGRILAWVILLGGSVLLVAAG